MTPWTVAYQAPPSMEFSRQEYWSGLPFPSAGDLSNPGIKPTSPALAGRFFIVEPPGKARHALIHGVFHIIATCNNSTVVCYLTFQVLMTPLPGNLIKF